MRLLAGLLGAARLVAQPAPGYEFGTELVAELAAQKPRQNVFVSPISVLMALGMAELGTSGPTREAIRRTTGTDPDALASLSRSLRARNGVELSIANAVWADRRITLAPAFVSQCRELFQADARTLDFLDPEAAEVINAWVPHETRNKIDGIVNRRTVAGAKTILTNAVYFKGKWQIPFAKELTSPAAFHLGSGERKVPFMHAPLLRGAYRNGDGFEAAILPYGPPDAPAEMELCILLPAVGTRPENLRARVPLPAPQQDVDLELRLPKFTLNFDASLKPALNRMGMTRAFEPAPGLFIGDVFHRSRLEIDEEGTVAAAVTAIVAPTGAAPPRMRQKKTLIIDRPFALIVFDRRTNATLFAGVVYDPQNQQP